MNEQIINEPMSNSYNMPFYHPVVEGYLDIDCKIQSVQGDYRRGCGLSTASLDIAPVGGI
jgi:hypothetical protein